MKNKLLFVPALLVCAFIILSGSAFGLSITTLGDGSPALTPDDLVSILLGSGITVVPGTIVYNGAQVASGSFTDGLAAGIGIQSGILLTSGSAVNALGPNDDDAKTTDNGLGGDSDLSAYVPGYTSYDATSLEFDFTTSTDNLYFNYVFASEEYNEYTNTSFNDAFAFFLDGVNLALIPGTTIPVAINNVNGGNPLGTDASYPEYFNNNDLQDGGPFFNIQYDGFTDLFTAEALNLAAGPHHIKLVISDFGDRVLDSGVFLQGGSFAGEQIPEPATFLLLGAGLAGIGLLRRRFKS